MNQGLILWGYSRMNQGLITLEKYHSATLFWESLHCVQEVTICIESFQDVTNLRSVDFGIGPMSGRCNCAVVNKNDVPGSWERYAGTYIGYQYNATLPGATMYVCDLQPSADVNRSGLCTKFNATVSADYVVMIGKLHRSK